MSLVALASTSCLLTGGGEVIGGTRKGWPIQHSYTTKPTPKATGRSRLPQGWRNAHGIVTGSVARANRSCQGAPLRIDSRAMKNPHAVELGRLGGKSTSERKKVAVRKNLKKALAARKKKALTKAVRVE